MCYACVIHVLFLAWTSWKFHIWHTKDRKGSLEYFHSYCGLALGSDILQTCRVRLGPKHRVDSNRWGWMSQLTESPGHFIYLSCPGSGAISSPLSVSLVPNPLTLFEERSTETCLRKTELLNWIGHVKAHFVCYVRRGERRKSESSSQAEWDKFYKVPGRLAGLCLRLE